MLNKTLPRKHTNKIITIKNRTNAPLTGQEQQHTTNHHNPTTATLIHLIQQEEKPKESVERYSTADLDCNSLTQIDVTSRQQYHPADPAQTTTKTTRPNPNFIAKHRRH